MQWQMGLFLSGTSCSDAHVGIDDTVSLAHLDVVAALGASPVPAAGPAGCWHCAAAAIALRLWDSSRGSVTRSLRIDIPDNQ